MGIKKFKYSGSYMSEKLGISLKKFQELVNANVFDFVTVRQVNGRKKYYYDPLKAEQYLNEYKNVTKGS